MKKELTFSVWLSFCLLFLRNLLSYSEPEVSFGKNKVIVDQHAWYIAETDHFEIYHYPEEKHLIPKVSTLLEKAYEKVTGDLNVSIEKRHLSSYTQHITTSSRTTLRIQEREWAVSPSRIRTGL